MKKILPIILSITALLTLFSFNAFSIPLDTETPTETYTDTPTDTPTETPTLTLTETPSETPTITETETPTITDTPTITNTPTVTYTPTIAVPMNKLIAYPNPAYGEKVVIAYPVITDKTPEKVTIILSSAEGAEAGRVTDSTPNGYTEFPIKDLARGIYSFRVIIKYTDGTEEKLARKKFAVIK